MVAASSIQSLAGPGNLQCLAVFLGRCGYQSFRLYIRSMGDELSGRV